MVVFTCSECGQALKKNQVEKHYSFNCRNCQYLSCIDCGKEFWGNDYQSHTKCISEDQKYGGKNYVPKASANKGEIKQEKWIEHIKNTIASKNISGPLSSLLNQIMEYPNIPRKKSKFENFLQNSMKIRNPKLISETWEIFAQSTKSETNTPSKDNSSINTPNGTKVPLKRGSETNTPSKDNSSVNTPNGTNVPLKRGVDSEDTTSKKARREAPPDQKSTGDSFDWCGTCEKILQNFPTGLPERQLRKQVVAQYKIQSGSKCSLSKAEIKKKIRELLTNNSMFSVYVDNSEKPVS